jgi:hypothetical protein
MIRVERTYVRGESERRGPTVRRAISAEHIAARDVYPARRAAPAHVPNRSRVWTGAEQAALKLWVGEEEDGG